MTKIFSGDVGQYFSGLRSKEVISKLYLTNLGLPFTEMNEHYYCVKIWRIYVDGPTERETLKPEGVLTNTFTDSVSA
jgi:hypothetical protein